VIHSNIPKDPILPLETKKADKNINSKSKIKKIKATSINPTSINVVSIKKGSKPHSYEDFLSRLNIFFESNFDK
jgi:hypothetical protein